MISVKDPVVVQFFAMIAAGCLVWAMFIVWLVYG